MASATTIGPVGINPADLPALRRRAILACSIGNFFEIFDFTIYGFFAVPISRAFFPAGNPTLALLSTFATFGVAFLMRPVGAVIIGRYGDRHGRRAALVVTIALMAAATGLTGLVPSYALIGGLAPALLLLCRLGQGFSTGGEWGGAAAFLVEYAEPGKRGITGAWQQFSTQFGAIFGSGLGALLPWALSTDDFFAWGWRVPFLLGFVLGPVGYYLRRRVAETPVFERVVEERSVSHAPLGATLTEHFDMVIYAFGLSAVGPALQYTFNIFLPSMVQNQFKVDPSTALLAASLSLVWLTFLTPFIGWASDKVGRKVFILLSGAGALLFAWPLFQAVAASPDFWTMLVCECIAMTFLSFYTGVIPSILAELFPTQVRYTALSVSYGFSVMLFGGFAPLIATRLVAGTGSAVSPAFFVMAAGFISLWAIIKMPDRFNAPLH